MMETTCSWASCLETKNTGRLAAVRLRCLNAAYPLSPQEPPARTATRCNWNSPCTPQQGAQPHEEHTRDGHARVTQPSLPRILLLAETLNRPVLPPETAGFEIPANPRPPYPTSAIP